MAIFAQELLPPFGSHKHDIAWPRHLKGCFNGLFTVKNLMNLNVGIHDMIANCLNNLLGSSK